LKQGATGKEHRHTVLHNCREKNKGLIVGELQKKPMKKKNAEHCRMNRKLDKLESARSKLVSAENREKDEEERKNHEEDEEEYESSLAYSVLLSFQYLRSLSFRFPAVFQVISFRIFGPSPFPFLSIFRVISFQYLSSLSFPLLSIFQVISFQYLPPPSHFSFLSPSFELFPFRSLLRVSLGLPKKTFSLQ
jgi:hypothetical protein